MAAFGKNSDKAVNWFYFHFNHDAMVLVNAINMYIASSN